MSTFSMTTILNENFFSRSVKLKKIEKRKAVKLKSKQKLTLENYFIAAKVAANVCRA